MLLVGHVAGDGDHASKLRKLGAGGFERFGAAGVDNEGPAFRCESACQCEAEAT
jgi:hypothetical protein